MSEGGREGASEHLCSGLASCSEEEPSPPPGESAERPLLVREERGVRERGEGEARPVPLLAELRGLAPGCVGEVGLSRLATPSPTPPMAAGWL